ncbi:hypothetical protein M514_02598 [Trichuris suis]|uniref:DRBM domain-containing protein n=1 Tax=Trichuris suis TaxID=68888 RepID=A0A085NNH6_9BILA|nr:hypothetical protein M513_02598 [Trichuris suis]KFD71022.1 hypothetical protein M514_02598 [Trichuris suis]
MEENAITQWICILQPVWFVLMQVHDFYEKNKKQALSILNELSQFYAGHISYHWYTFVSDEGVTKSVLMRWDSLILQAQVTAITVKETRRLAAELLAHFLFCAGWLPKKLQPQLVQENVDFAYDQRVINVLQKVNVKNVVKLFEIQQKRHRPLPLFKVVEPEYPTANAGLYVVNAFCEGYSTVGFGRTKKMAKEMAAAEMNELIKSRMMSNRPTSFHRKGWNNSGITEQIETVETTWHLGEHRWVQVHYVRFP